MTKGCEKKTTTDFLWGDIEWQVSNLHCSMQKENIIEHTNAKYHVFTLVLTIT